MFFIHLKLNDHARERKLAESQRRDPHKHFEMERRHSQVTVSKNSFIASAANPISSPFPPVLKPTKQSKSMEEIKREYNQLGCQFYQIYHPSTQQNLQVYPGNSSIGASKDSNNFSSKYFSMRNN